MFWEVLRNVAINGVILFPLFAWLGKVWIGRTLERERAKTEGGLQLLRDRLDRGQFVHGLQFETEFKIYLELWGKLITAHDAAIRLRPLLDLAPKGKSKEEVDVERAKELHEAYVPFQACFREREPFIAPEVYEALKKLDTAIFCESVDFLDRDARSEKEYWEEGENNANLIKEHTKYICEAIRERIANTTILPEETRPAQ